MIMISCSMAVGEEKIEARGKVSKQANKQPKIEQGKESNRSFELD